MLTRKLISYYQKELAYLKTKGADFAVRFPKIARRLGIADGVSEDPHVERLIESFALLCANIQQRLDEDMPEVTNALFTALAPQFLRQLPSVCIIQMKPDSHSATFTELNVINAGAELYSRQSEGQTCRFRTVYPLTLFPVTLRQAYVKQNVCDLSWSLQLEFSVWPKAQISANTLRFFLHGATPAVNVMYTLLCSEVFSASVSVNDCVIPLTSNCVIPVGFAENELLLGTNAAISSVHSLLQEYFWFPKKFHFIDICLPDNFSASGPNSFSLSFLFNSCASTRHLTGMASLIDAGFFRLGCSPAVNLFSQRAEPIVLNDNAQEYPLIPDVRYPSHQEVWAIDKVEALVKQGNEIFPQSIQPLFGIDHSSRENSMDVWWQAVIQESTTGPGDATDWFIAFADRHEKLAAPRCDMIRVSLTCTNRDLPTALINGDPDGDFESTLPLAGINISALTRPTAPVRPQREQAMRWRLISQLALNHQLLSGSEGTRVLKETLSIYNLNPASDRIIEMISHIEVKPVMARLISADPRSVARGVEISILFAPEASHETEYFPLCQFLDHFLALYAPVNSFSQVVTSIASDVTTRRCWPIRAGRLLWL